MDWTAIASLATAAGTLVLAVATFASVRSANRAVRTAERGLELGLRPLLMPSRLEDPVQKIRWVDEHWTRLEGGRGSVEVADGNVYLAMSVRNAGTGIAVLQSWHAEPMGRPTAELTTPIEAFRPHMRDLYIPAGDIGFWQGAMRDANEGGYDALRDAVEGRRAILVEVLYGDHEIGRRTVSRFALTPGEGSTWLCSVSKHWQLDAPSGP